MRVKLNRVQEELIALLERLNVDVFVCTMLKTRELIILLLRKAIEIITCFHDRPKDKTARIRGLQSWSGHQN